MRISIACGCGKKLSVSDEHAGKKVKCPGCGAVLPVPRPSAGPVPAAAPAGEPEIDAEAVAAKPSGRRLPVWVIGLIVLGGVLMVVFVSFVSFKTVSGALSSKLNVDNLSADAVEVSVDGKPVGSVAPFEVGVFDITAGKRELSARGPGGEIDRTQAKVPPGKTTIYCPQGRGAYMMDVTVYTSRPFPINVQPGTGGGGGREFRNQKVIDADFGPLDPIPKEVVMMKEGETARVKLVRLPPDTLTVPEALAYLRTPREAFTGDATAVAFSACAASIETKGARGGVVLCLERLGYMAADAAFPLVWKHGIDIPEERLAKWVTAPESPGADSHSVELRAMHAALLLAQKGKLDAAARLPAARVRNLHNVHFEDIFKELSPERAQPLFRGMLSVFPEHAQNVLRLALFVPDAETARQIDEFIQRLPPDPKGGFGPKANWLEALARSLEKGGGSLSLEQMLAQLDNAGSGTRSNELAAKLVGTGRFHDLAVARITPGARRALAHQYSIWRRQKKTPVTDDQIEFLDAALREPNEILRTSVVTGLASTLRDQRDERLIGWIRAAIDKETNADAKRNMQAHLRANLGEK